LLAAPLALLAQADTRAADKPAIPSVGTTAEEDEVYALFREEKLLSARTRAQALLDKNPRSAVGHFVLGSVLREAEGSLPRSLAHLREAKRLNRERAFSKDAGALKLQADILWSLQVTAGLMEKFDLQLEILDERDRQFVPVPARHAWPLMKLRRFDDAREYARQGLATGNPWQEMMALNALCAVEGEDHQRGGHFDACKRAFEKAKGRPGGEIAVHAHNAALGALSMLRFEEAERFALAGTARIEQSASNPWRLLAEIYAGEGRADETVSALREMQRWNAAQPPQYREQKSAENDAVIAVVLLAAGDAATGLHFIHRALDRPDRRAMTSSNPEQSLGGGAILRRALYRLDAEQRAERASARGVTDRASALASALSIRAAEWPDEERAIAVLADDERLTLTLRPYQDGGLEPCPPWVASDLVGLLGPGVVGAALARARRADASFPDATPYYDAIEAEIALARGEPRRALALAEGALDRLPRAEALLRARVAALGAEGAARAGQVAASLSFFERALALDPGVLRRLGIALPARVEAAGRAAEDAAARIRRSPRLTASASGFVVRVEGDDRHLKACLLTPSAAVLGCGEATRNAGEALPDLAARLADDFHRAAFAMKFSLTPTDLRSLDGSTTAAQGSAREALRGLLHETPDAPQP
jgi:tetratricopeptide (TPR) repeat protein